MRKISLSPYQITVRDQEGKPKDSPYLVRESISTLLFHPALKLTIVNYIKQEELEKKIRTAGDFVLLEEEEYDRVVNALKVIEGLSKDDGEFVHRIIDAEKIEVAPV